MTHETPPIACTLAPGEFIDRLKWIADLTRDDLRSRGRRDLELTLRYAPEAVERVREMVRREQACCAFLTFELEESPEEIRVTVRAPEEARLAANMIFALFGEWTAREAPAMPTHKSPAASIGIWRHISGIFGKS